MEWTRGGRAWRWIRAGSKERASMAQGLIDAASKGSVEDLLALWERGARPRGLGCALTVGIRTWGADSPVCALLRELYPKGFGSGMALGQALALPDQTWVDELAALLPAGGEAAQSVAWGLSRLYPLNAPLALARAGALAGERPGLLKGLSEKFALYGEEALLEKALEVAARTPARWGRGSRLLECERAALMSFAKGRYRDREMAPLSEGMLRRLVASASPEQALQAGLMGKKSARLWRLTQARLNGETEAFEPKKSARWLMEAMLNETVSHRYPPRERWWADPALLPVLESLVSEASPEELGLAARALCERGERSSAEERALLLDLVLAALPFERAERELALGMEMERGPEGPGPLQAARREAREIALALGESGMGVKKARRL